MTITCASCGTTSPDGFRFCGACGAHLASAAAPAGGAERRQLTVMFCDLVESTALAERLDPEELRDVIRAVQAAVKQAVTRYGGHIAQYLGDGVLVYFGFPEAHEDDARRALHAGLGVLTAVNELATRAELAAVPIAVRIGVHTGPVVAGEMGAGEDRESLAVGATPNIAARLQGLAEPGTIALSETTLRLTRDAFEYESLGKHPVKGVSAPLGVFRVLRIKQSDDAGGLQRAALTPPVGRRAELDKLHAALASAHAGSGRIVHISGGPGIGKSRLVRMFRDEAGSAIESWMVASCSPYEESTAFSAITELLRRVFRVGSEVEGGAALSRLEQSLGRLGLPLEEAVPLFADLLSIPLEGRYPPTGLMFYKRRERTIQLLIDLLFAHARQQSAVLVVEDVHWADPSTRQFLQALVAAAPDAALLTLLAYRPGFEPSWPVDQHVVDITLERLDTDSARELLQHVLGGRTMPPGPETQILAKADGVPLYLEELTKMVLESGQLRRENGRYVLAGSLLALDIPETLQASLTARLDRLGAAKELAQTAAVLGREFSYDVLAAVWQPAPGLRERLRALVESGLVLQRDLEPSLAFQFKHALIRDAAYESLLKSARQQHHRRVAEVLTTQFTELAERSPELLAHHYEGAAIPNRAIESWVAASRRAFWRSAYLEAIEHCRRGLALVESLDDEQRIPYELELLVTLGPALTATHGYADPEVGEIYSRARMLCEQVGDAPQMFWVLWGIGSYYFNRAELQKSYDAAQLMAGIARAQNERTLLCEACFAVGVTSTLRGQIKEASGALEEGVMLNTPDRDRKFTALTGVDCAVATLSFATLAAQLRNEPDVAVRHIENAIAEARRVDHPFSLGFALTHAVFLHSFRCEPERVRFYAEEGLPLCEERGIVIFMPLIGFCVAAADGGPGAGEAMRANLAAWRGIGSDVWQTYFMARLAEWHLAHGDADTARTLTEQAIAAAERTGERIWYPVLLCLRGDLAQEPAAAASAYRAAVEAARAQGALWFERRAADALARITS